MMEGLARATALILLSHPEDAETSPRNGGTESLLSPSLRIADARFTIEGIAVETGAFTKLT